MPRGALVTAALLLGAAALWFLLEAGAPAGESPAPPERSGSESAPELGGRAPAPAKGKVATEDEVLQELARLEAEYTRARLADGGLGLAQRWSSVGPQAVPALLAWSTQTGRRWKGFTRGSVAGAAIYLMGSTALPALRQALGDAREAVRAAAARLLWELTREAQHALPHLIAYLGGDRRWRTDPVAGPSLRCLWQMGPQAEPARDLLQSLVDVDESVEVRDYVVSRGDLPAPRPSKRRRRSRSVATWALAALGRLGDDSSAAVADLERTARSVKHSSKQRAAVRALLDLGTSGHAALDRMLRGSDGALADVAAEVLVQQKPTAAVLAAALEDGSTVVRCRCMYAVAYAAVRRELEASTHAAWLERLEQALRGTDRVVARGAARAVAAVGQARNATFRTNVRCVRVLTAALRHDELKVRSEAAIGLSKGWWSSAEARGALMEHYPTLDAPARRAVLWALGTDDEPDRRRDEVLLGALADVDEFVQIAALGALTRVMQDRPRLEAILERATQSPSPHVRSAVAQMLEDLAEDDED